MYENEELELIGRLVTSVVADDPHQESVTLNLDNGKQARLVLDGDCCSHSYFTDVSQFQELVGATIQSFVEEYGKSNPSLEDGDNGAEGVSWHFLKIKTDKSHVTIDWRNDSNGYYDGSLHVSVS